jgi:hypothetical protein
MREKYLVLELSRRNGLTDMKDRFTEFLKISQFMGLIPILPTIYLSSQHTSKEKSILTDYIEIPDFVLYELPKGVNRAEIYFWIPADYFNDLLFRRYRGRIENDSFIVEFKKCYRELAEKIVATLARPICCVHVRRTDYLEIHPSLNADTSPLNIERVLNKYAFSTCYIMTSEKDTHFFDTLKKKFTIKLYTDFPELASLIQDNYAVYAVECCIRALSDIRISTFNTKKTHPSVLPNNDPSFFCDSLSEIEGFQ